MPDKEQEVRGDNQSSPDNTNFHRNSSTSYQTGLSQKQGKILPLMRCLNLKMLVADKLLADSFFLFCFCLCFDESSFK